MLAPSDPGAIGPAYREYAPPPDLAPYVRCLWRIAAGNARPERGGCGLGPVRTELGVGERMRLSPKAFERIARFRRAVERIQRRPRTSYAAVALDTGYADPAHLIRESSPSLA